MVSAFSALLILVAVADVHRVNAGKEEPRTKAAFLIKGITAVLALEHVEDCHHAAALYRLFTLFVQFPFHP